VDAVAKLAELDGHSRVIRRRENKDMALAPELAHETEDGELTEMHPCRRRYWHVSKQRQDPHLTLAW
jgi:hypothetical protein